MLKKDAKVGDHTLIEKVGTKENLTIEKCR